MSAVFWNTLHEKLPFKFDPCKCVQILKINPGQVLLQRLVEVFLLAALKVYLLNSFYLDDHLSQSYGTGITSNKAMFSLEKGFSTFE